MEAILPTSARLQIPSQSQYGLADPDAERTTARFLTDPDGNSSTASRYAKKDLDSRIKQASSPNYNSLNHLTLLSTPNHSMRKASHEISFLLTVEKQAFEIRL